MKRLVMPKKSKKKSTPYTRSKNVGGESRPTSNNSSGGKSRMPRKSAPLSKSKPRSRIAGHDTMAALQLELALALAASSDIYEASRRVVETCLRIPGYDCGGIYLVDSETNALNLIASSGLSDSFVAKYRHLDSGSSQDEFVRAMRPYHGLYGDVEAQFALENEERLSTISILPIFDRGEPVACLNMASHQETEISRVARTTIETIGLQIGAVFSRLRTEAALQKSEQNYRSLFRLMRLMCDNVPDMIWAKDLNKKYIFANAAMSQELFHAHDNDEPVGKTDMFFAQRERAMKPADPAWHTFGEICADSDSVVIKEKASRRFDEFGNVRGKFLYLDVHKAPLWDEQGTMIGTVGCGRDVTEEKEREVERHQIASALRESEEKYRTLFENLPVGIFRSTAAGRLISINPTFAAMFGYRTPEEMSDINAADLYFDRSERDSYVADLKKSKEEYSAHEFRMRRRDEASFWVLSNVRAIRDGQGEIQFLDGTIRDITELKRTYGALRESEERFRTIFETAHDAIFIKDSQSRYISVNAGMERLFGTSREHLIGRTDLELFGPEEGANNQETDRRAMAGEMVEKEHTTTIRGESLIFHVCKVPMRNPDGAVTGICGIARDVTEKRRLEAELVRSDKLESIGVLAGGIAHDFNNLLTAIMGNVSLVKSEHDPNGQSFQCLSDVEKAAVRAKGLTHQLLTFAKGGTPHKEVIQLGEVVREATLFSLTGSSVKCEFDFAPDLYDVEADGDQISQVISNLVINAVQAMPKGGIIRIKLENADTTDHGIPTASAERWVQICVSDQGDGIPATILPKIFDPFFTTKESGNGLGLAIVYSIITKHGGHVEVYSCEGSGATFTILIPAVTKTARTSTNLPDDDLRGDGRILVMDDEVLIRQMADLCLTHYGYDVVTVADGAGAIAEFESARTADRPFHLVILDLTIPGGVGGAVTLERLRRIDPEIRAILASGYSSDRAVTDFAALGFSGRIHKPYRAETLARAVLTAMEINAETSG